MSEIELCPSCGSSAHAPGSCLEIREKEKKIEKATPVFPRYFPEGVVFAEDNRNEKGEKRLTVLLLIPSYTFDPGYETRRVSAPLGLEAVANELVMRGFNVIFVDAARAKYDQVVRLDMETATYGLSDEQLKDVLKQFSDVDVVGITNMFSNQNHNVRGTVELLRKIYPNAMIVEGGAHATGAFEEVLQNDPDVDVVVRRQGMITFANLCETMERTKDRNSWKSGKLLKNINGIAFRDEKGAVIKNSDQPFVKNLDELAPRLLEIELHPMYDTTEHTGGSRGVEIGRYAYIMTGYGCPGRCGFCTAEMMSGREVGQFSLERIDQDVKKLKEAGVTELIVEDDQFLFDIPRAMAIMDIFKKYGMRWFEEGGISMFKLMKPGGGYDYQKIIDKMAESGCYRFYLAIESANPESLAKLNKPTVNTVADSAEEIVKYIASKGIQAVGGFMLGFKAPDYEESLEDMEKTVAYAKRLKEAGLSFVILFIYTALPGSRIYDYLKPFIEQEMVKYQSYEKSGFFRAGLPVWDLDGLRLEWMREINGPEAMDKVKKTMNWGV